MTPVKTVKHATVVPLPGSKVNAKMTFTETLDDKTGAGNLVVSGTASGFLTKATIYVSLAYGLGSSPTGPTPCRDDGSLGGVILDPQDVLGVTDLLDPILNAIPIVGPGIDAALKASLLKALTTALGPLNPVNLPPPGGLLFSPKATARMLLGVWGPPNKAGTSTFVPIPKVWTSFDDPVGLPLAKIATVSMRQPQFPLLPDLLKDIRPQIFQLRACGPIL